MSNNRGFLTGMTLTGAACLLTTANALGADAMPATAGMSANPATTTTNSMPAEAGTDVSRFSDQPAPLQLQGFPKRPAPLIEIGDKFLGSGNLQNGFTLPTGAVWTPNFWVFGTLRSAFQTFDPGVGHGTRYTEWANRLDIYGNLYLSPTERIVVGFRPFDQNTAGNSGYVFEPKAGGGWVNMASATPRTLFFEGELGEIFPHWDKSDSRSLDYSFAVGRQPLSLQDGLLVGSDSVDMVSVTRNALTLPGGSTLRVSALDAWGDIQHQNFNLDSVPNVADHGANMFGLDAAADFPVSTVEANVLYETAPDHGDSVYAGLGAIQRIWKFNTTFRAVTSVATQGSSARATTGTLLLSQISYDLPYSADIVYLDSFWGIHAYESADRDPTAGGPLGNIGILNAAAGLGHYGAPLGNEPDHAVGGALGYQMFFGDLRRRQVVIEIGGRAPTQAPTQLRQEAAEGIAVRFQQAIGRRCVLVMDTFGVNRDTSSGTVGGRMELEVKF